MSKLLEHIIRETLLVEQYKQKYTSCKDLQLAAKENPQKFSEPGDVVDPTRSEQRSLSAIQDVDAANYNAAKAAGAVEAFNIIICINKKDKTLNNVDKILNQIGNSDVVFPKWLSPYFEATVTDANGIVTDKYALLHSSYDNDKSQMINFWIFEASKFEQSKTRTFDKISSREMKSDLVKGLSQLRDVHLNASPTGKKWYNIMRYDADAAEKFKNLTAEDAFIIAKSIQQELIKKNVTEPGSAGFTGSITALSDVGPKFRGLQMYNIAYPAIKFPKSFYAIGSSKQVKDTSASKYRYKKIKIQYPFNIPGTKTWVYKINNMVYVLADENLGGVITDNPNQKNRVFKTSASLFEPVVQEFGIQVKNKDGDWELVHGPGTSGDLELRSLGFSLRDAVPLGSQIENDIYDLAKKQGEIPTTSTEE